MQCCLAVFDRLVVLYDCAGPRADHRAATPGRRVALHAHSPDLICKLVQEHRTAVPYTSYSTAAHGRRSPRTLPLNKPTNHNTSPTNQPTYPCRCRCTWSAARSCGSRRTLWMRCVRPPHGPRTCTTRRPPRVGATVPTLVLRHTFIVFVPTGIICSDTGAFFCIRAYYLLGARTGPQTCTTRRPPRVGALSVAPTLCVVCVCMDLHDKKATEGGCYGTTFCACYLLFRYLCYFCAYYDLFGHDKKATEGGWHRTTTLFIW